MKALAYVVALLVGTLVSFYTGSESYRRTTGDMYQESYAEEMREMVARSTAEIRAAQYRAMIEKCDQHHNCPPAEQAGHWIWPSHGASVWA